MSREKKGVYWGKTEEDAVIRWTQATTNKEYSELYRLLLPKMRKMCEIIMRTYYAATPIARQEEIIDDALQQVFLKLKEYDTNKVRNGNGAYSYCSLILKRYIYDVSINNQKKYTHTHNNITYVDEYDEHSKVVEYAEREEIDYSIIIRYLKDKQKHLRVLDKLSKKSHGKGYQPIRYQREINYVDLIIEYINKYQDITPAAIADYVFYNDKGKKKIRKTVTVYYLRKILGIYRSKYDRLKDGKSVDFKSTDKGNNDAKYGYIQDDIVPNESVYKKRVGCKQIMKKYKDMKDYSYF